MALSACSNSSDDNEGPGLPGGSTGNNPGGNASKTYKIGWQGPLSGDNQQLGINEANGSRLAVKEANDKGDLGFKLVMVESDDVGTADKAPAAAAKLLQDADILGVVGPAFSGPTSATGKTYAAANMGLISGSATNATLTSSGFTTFHRVVPTDGVEGTQLAEWLAKKFKTVFVVDDTSTYGKGVADVVRKTLTEKGVKITNQGVAANTQDYGAIAQRVTQSKAEALFYGGYDAQSALFAKALAASGYKGLKMTGNGGKSSVFTSGAGAAGNGWYFACGCQDATTAPESKAFAEAYEKMFNTPPSTYSPESYDATNALIAALKAAVKTTNGNPTRKSVVEEIDKLDIPGITTQLKFADNGEVANATVNLYTQKDGKIVMLGKMQDQA
ncbi:MAG TPA: branched-chain amino acid ABC transporter substrate-binding protein [Jatrophihabitans sp.]|jgi:branched-chain amino acid transport system substrate-binding protein|uniref:branched-chain amino acid ABC transporter substrate-binding protein n=1 Tax=Jatrophihabitans sp. TaxID=1932789 RepID=UPI002F223E6B